MTKLQGFGLYDIGSKKKGRVVLAVYVLQVAYGVCDLVILARALELEFEIT